MDIQRDKITPVMIGIRVEEADSLAKRNLAKGGPGVIGAAAGGAAAASLKGSDCRVSVVAGSPQRFYPGCTKTYYRYTYGTAVVEGQDETQVLAMKARLDKIAPGLDLRKEDDRKAFVSRYQAGREGNGPSGGVARIAAKDGLFAWLSVCFGE